MSSPSSARCHRPTRRGLLAAGLAAAAAGCNHHDRRRAGPYALQPEPEPEPGPAPAPAATAHDPWQATGGRLFRPDAPSEPWAPPGRWRELTPGRVRLWVPAFLRGHPELEDGAIAEVLHVTPEGDTRIPAGWSGVDPDPGAYPPCAVVIHDPHGYSLPADAQAVTAVLVAGHWIRESWLDAQGQLQEWDVLHVAWRVRELREASLLPALAHELRHRLTRDVLAGHAGGCCARMELAP